MTESLDDILDSLFHFAALRAYMEQAAVSSGPPCPHSTRQRAYRHYENALAEKRGEPPRYSSE